ncbi:MAG TPA: ABC transporter permease [Clostridia bacterium]|nr:ABC transporter permease [Clostridia bacterium]
MLTFKLASRTLLREKARSTSAIIGIAAAVALLAWHIELAMTAISQAETAVNKATAPFSAWITGPSTGSRITPSKTKGTQPALKGSRATADATVGFRRGRGGTGPLPQALVDKLTASEKTLKATFLTVQTASLDVRPGGRVLQGPPLSGKISTISVNDTPQFQSQVLNTGRWPIHTSTDYEAAVSIQLFEGRRLPLPELGSEIPILLRGGTVTLKIVGLFNSNPLVAAFPNVYTTPTAMEAIARLTPGGSPPNLALCEPLAGKTVDDIEHILSSVPQADACIFSTRGAVESRFRSDTVTNLVKQLPLSLSLAFITSVFMLGTVLTTGISGHRQRIALLRCSGMTRSGTVLLMIYETVIMTVIGWIVGVFAATFFVQIFLIVEQSSELPKLVHPGWQTPVLTGMMAFATALLSVIIPCIQATRVRPLEITERDVSELKQISLFRTMLGITLLIPLIVLSLPFNIGPIHRCILMIAVGLPAYVTGSILCLHPLMRLVEILFLIPIGKLLRIDSRILSRRLSRAPGRAIGTIMTLSLGLGAFMSIHIWGGSLMSSYVPSAEWPDIIVSVLPNGLTPDEFTAAAHVEGAQTPVIPIEAAQFSLDPETLATLKNAGLPELKSDLLLVFGVDPALAFGGKAPLADFRFVEGNRKEAAAQLENEDACLVPVMFSRLTGLHQGDTFSLAGKSLKIAGVVDLNWHMVTSRSKVRSRVGKLDKPANSGRRQAGGIGSPSPQNIETNSARDQSQPSTEKPTMMKPTMGMAFTSEKLVRSITGNSDTVYFMWLNLSPELRKINPLQATVRLDTALNKAIARAHPDSSKPAFINANALQVHHRDEILDGTLAHGNDILGTMARIPFWSLIVTSWGIVAMLVASAHASKRETDVMRAIGMTRSQFMRIFTAEALLVILCTLVISLIGGMLIGWSFTAVTAEKMAAGLSRSLVIPWRLIGQGVLFVIAMTLLMTAIPLCRITRDNP